MHRAASTAAGPLDGSGEPETQGQQPLVSSHSFSVHLEHIIIFLWLLYVKQLGDINSVFSH